VVRVGSEAGLLPQVHKGRAKISPQCADDADEPEVKGLPVVDVDAPGEMGE
jgi:hypothetical protein